MAGHRGAKDWTDYLNGLNGGFERSEPPSFFIITRRKIHAAAVKQVDDMPDAEGHAGNNNGRLDIVLCNGLKKQTPEDHFLPKSDAEHTHDAADRFSR